MTDILTRLDLGDRGFVRFGDEYSLRYYLNKNPILIGRNKH